MKNTSLKQSSSRSATKLKLNERKTHEKLQTPQNKSWMKNRKVTVLIAGLIALSLLFVFKKELFVAAIVNGRPIFRWRVNKVLVTRFGQQTLEGMIGEVLVEDAAKEAGVSVSKQELESKEQEIIGDLGEDVDIDQLLQFQGLTRAEFQNQIKIQMLIEKVLGTDITITKSDIDAFIATNSASLRSNDETGQRNEARELIYNQRIGDKVQPWFQILRTEANVINFLK